MTAGFQPFSIKRCINVVSTLKQQLTLFQPYFNVEGRSCAGWVISDSFKDLVVKKNVLLLGKDIWNKDESRGVHVKKKMLDTRNEVEAKIARLVSGYG